MSHAGFTATLYCGALDKGGPTLAGKNTTILVGTDPFPCPKTLSWTAVGGKGFVSTGGR
jgi:hypothetical protein